MLIQIDVIFFASFPFFGRTYQFSDAAVLPDYSPRPAELGHVGDRLGSQGLELLDRWVQDGHDTLQASHVNDGSTDLHVVANLPEDFERSDLEKHRQETHSFIKNNAVFMEKRLQA